jgi:hypothetical protein
MGQFTRAEVVELEKLLRVGCCCAGPMPSVCPIHVSRELVRAVRRVVTACPGCREKKEQVAVLQVDLDEARQEALLARRRVMQLEDGVTP